MKKIAILLLVHKSPEQLEHLLRRMDDNRFDIYIHVDAKSDINQFKEVKNQVKASEVFFVKERIKTYFNDFSLVQATVNTIKEAISKEYKYYILLTGQDYPIKSNDYIYEKLSNDYPISYIDMYGVEESFSKGVSWVEHIGYSYPCVWLNDIPDSPFKYEDYYLSTGRFTFPIVNNVEEGYIKTGKLILK